MCGVGLLFDFIIESLSSNCQSHSPSNPNSLPLPLSCHRYAVKDFCFKNSISPDQLKERLKIFDASLAAVQVNTMDMTHPARYMSCALFLR